jgi:UDP-glucuronate decarboxylase
MKNKIIDEDLEMIYKSDIEWEKFTNSTILVTGANGFLPAYLVETFLYLNHIKPSYNIKIICLVRNKKKAESRFDSYLKNTNFRLLIQDVCEQISITENVDFIIHAASQASPKYYGSDPVGTLMPNILGTINLLELAKIKKVKSFLFFSSGEVYGQVNSINIDENDYGYLDPTNIRSCYGESKRMGENICISYFHQFGIPTKIVRPFHTYGPGMDLNDGRVFSDFVSSVVNKKSININSDGSAIRAFCYLTDATIGFIKILLDGKLGEAYNIGNPNETSTISNLAIVISKLYAEKNTEIIFNNELDEKKNYLKSNINKVVPSIEKAIKLCWSPQISIVDGFRRTIDSFIA